MLNEKQNNVEAQAQEIHELIEQATIKTIGLSKSDSEKSKRFKIESRDGKNLTYFGAKHTNDKEHPQYLEMQPEITKLFEGVPSERCAIIVESEKRVSVLHQEPIDDNKAIEAGGESAYAINIAHRLGIDYFMFEPADSALVEYIAQQYSKDLAFLHFAGRGIRNFDAHKSQHLRDYMQPYIKRFAQTSGWTDFDCTFDNLENIWENVTGNRFTPDQKDIFDKYYDPKRQDSKLNAITRTENIYRDSIVVNNIAKLIRHGKTHFYIVYGSGHAATQKAALEFVMENN